jgi:hypothetical protein
MKIFIEVSFNSDKNRIYFITVTCTDSLILINHLAVCKHHLILYLSSSGNSSIDFLLKFRKHFDLFHNVFHIFENICDS